MAQDVFGSDQQKSLLRKGAALFEIARDHPGLTYYGRTMGVLPTHPDAYSLLRRLITLQGSGTAFPVPPAEADRLEAELTAEGFSITRYATWRGGPETLAAADAILARYPLPDDIDVRLLGTDSPDGDIEALAEVALALGVLPIATPVLTGTAKPGVGAVALDRDGRPVSCAASASYAPPSDPTLGHVAWWGMLATMDHRKGERLALILGAMVMRAMHDRFGFDHFFTGIVPGNAASEAVSGKSGLSPVPDVIVTVVDPAALAGGKLTR